MLDTTDWKILSILQENGRSSFSEIARQVNLTAPAVAERVRKLEEGDIITGYHAAINSEQLGYGITCFVHLTMAPEIEDQFLEFAQDCIEILECYITTGENAFVLKVIAPNVGYLHSFLNTLLTFGSATSYLILSQEITRRTIQKNKHIKP